MIKKIQKYQRLLLTALIVICMGIMALGAGVYLQRIKANLKNSAIQDVMNVTIQQRQAFEDFVFGDRERLHICAEYFSKNGHDEDLQDLLATFAGADANFAVVCLEENWIYSSNHGKVMHSEPEEMDEYHSLSGSGIRDNYVGLTSGVSKFAFYETFTFQNGHPGLIQKSYDRNKVLESFSLSIYNGEGFGYILDPEGDILLRSVLRKESQTYENIFDALSDVHVPQADVDAFRAALDANETGSIVFRGDYGDYIYTFAPIESMDGWHILSSVPVDTIQNVADEIMRDTQIMMGFFALMLVICATFIFLVWRTQKEIKAKEQETAYRSKLFDFSFTYLSQNTDDMYIILDHETEKLEYVSPNLERVLGITPDELIPYFQASDAAAGAEAVAYYAKIRTLRPGEMAEPRNAERVNPKTGECRYFLESTYCVDIQGRKKRVFYLSDRTKERKTQNDLAEALHMAQAANDAKSAFLSSVSHDIRTPMNAIIGFLALMRDEVNNPSTVMEYNKRIDAASQHLLGLINDVLDMNKIESGSATLTISEMDMADVINEINSIIRPQTNAKGQTFDIVATHMNFEHLLGDKMRLNQILINLLSNAVKYTPENGTIQLGMEEMPQVVNNYSRVRFTISDNGMGMSEAYQKVLFEPFTREEDNPAVHEIQGTGLGMPITKNLVEMMGGTIKVESKLGEGSTFTVEIEFQIQERDVDPEFWTNHRLAKLIVADDDEEVCYHIVKTMSKVGVVTDFATNGHTAVQMMREHREAGEPYDMILLDWKMPTLDGIETARLIRKNYPDKIPILLLTAYDWSDIEQEAKEIGVDHFMPKPFFMSTFKEAVKRVMGGHQDKLVENKTDVVRDKHILVVDDIEVNRMILLKILSLLGASCDSANNGQEAVDKFETSQPGDYDLILMDVQMPVMDGYAATQAIRSSGHPSAKSVPIIAMTANAFVDDVRDAIASGMDAHIAKPVQVDNLKTTIQQVLDKRAEQNNG
ncbi:MAG: response regulator [Lachnospiraceae bacterium]|nr:response regulator [Lachnospiraceae bacterium]